MYLKPKKIILIGFLCCFCSHFFAQENEYRAEIGVLGGLAYYMGDANTLPFKNSTPDYGILFRYKFTPRFAARAELTRSSIKGGSELNTFDNPVNVLDICGEFNFFDLEKSKYKRFSKTFAPYIFLGLGAMNYQYTGSQKFGVSLPFGVGLKIKLGERFNFNAQFSNRLLFNDNLEGIKIFNDPNKLNGSNFMNNDLLSTLTVGVTFDIWKKDCGCTKF